MMCSRCKQDKSPSEFRERNSQRGTYSWCKQCCTEDTTERTTRSKILCLAHYGGWPPKCKCCGETIIQFLTFDHEVNIGKDRKHAGKNLADDLVRENFPPGYQVLCMNCNFAKGIYGKCPHEEQNGQ